MLELALGRFGTDASLLLTFIEEALAVAATAATAAGSNAGSNGSSSVQQQLETLVLQIFESNEATVAAVQGDNAASMRLYRLLYNYGTTKFESKAVEAAVKFFESALQFAEVRRRRQLAR